MIDRDHYIRMWGTRDAIRILKEALCNGGDEKILHNAILYLENRRG